MDDAQFQKIWSDVLSETADRSKGAFKRALWYGNNSAVFGQNKGLRKAIRNAPRKVATGALGLANMPPGISDAIDGVVDIVLTKGKELYSAHVKPLIRGDRPMAAEEKVRKQIKATVKDLKANAFQVIDRNLVKLKDAKNKVSPAIQEMMKAQSPPSLSSVPSNVAVPTDEQQLQKAHVALRAVAETQYYIDKLASLVTATSTALEGIMKGLNELKVAAEQTQEEVSDYVCEFF
ncbi:MAG: hypothetical protein U1E73_10315 [Planctomycetota bacterium]